VPVFMYWMYEMRSHGCIILGVYDTSLLYSNQLHMPHFLPHCFYVITLFTARCL